MFLCIPFNNVFSKKYYFNEHRNTVKSEIEKETIKSSNTVVEINNLSLLENCVNPDEIGGTVYREFKMDGNADAAFNKVFSSSNPTPINENITVRDAEPRLSGVIVNVYDTNNSLIGTTTTDINGEWLLSVAAATNNQVLVEFLLPTGYSYSPTGTENSSSIVVATKGDCEVNFTCAIANQHCQDVPPIHIVCYTSEYNEDNFPEFDNFPVDPNEPMLVTVSPDDSGPWVQSSAPRDESQYCPGCYDPDHFPNTPTKTPIATYGTVGTIFGVSYDKINDRLLASAYERAYAQIKDGEGVIYSIAPDGSNTNVWLDLETILGANIAGIDPPYNVPNTFSDASYRIEHNKIGHIGLGDVEISGDGKTLYVINLFSREIYAIPIRPQGAAPLTASEIKTYTLPDPCGSGGQFWPAVGWDDDNNGTPDRPYAAVMSLGIHPDGSVYTSVTCSGPTATDISATIYSFDPTATTGSNGTHANGSQAYNATAFTNELNLDLEITEPISLWNTFLSPPSYTYADNQDWISLPEDTALPFNPNGAYSVNERHIVVSDIAFDVRADGDINMVIGTRNRVWDMIGIGDFVNAGELFLACGNTSGNWILENTAGACNTYSTSNDLSIDHFNNQNGKGVFFNDIGGEGVFSTGTISTIPGFTELLVGGMDNINKSVNSGIAFLKLDNGARSRDIRLMGSRVTNRSGGTAQGAGGTSISQAAVRKANAWGDVECACEAAPIEIGNLVWRDMNSNGIQDPMEAGIPNISIHLYQDNNGNGTYESGTDVLVATAITDANGQYYFRKDATGSSVSNGAGFEAGQSLNYYTNYLLAVDEASDFAANGELYQYQLTLANALGGGDADGLADQNQAILNSPYSNEMAFDGTRDSDALYSGTSTGSNLIAFSTGQPGDNNHSYDIGFEPACPAIICLPTLVSKNF